MKNVKYHLAFLNYPQIAVLINSFTFQIEVVNNKFEERVMSGGNAIKLIFSIDLIKPEDQLSFHLAIERLNNDNAMNEIKVSLLTLTLQSDHHCKQFICFTLNRNIKFLYHMH